MAKTDDDDVSKAAALARKISSDIAVTRERQAQDSLAQRPVGRDGARIRQVMSAVLIVLSVGLTALNVAGRMPFAHTSTKPASDAERMTHLRRTLNYAVRAIEAYRKAHGQWPSSLALVGAPSDVPWSYALDHHGGYSIALTDGALTARYDSSQDAATVFADLRHP